MTIWVFLVLVPSFLLLGWSISFGILTPRNQSSSRLPTANLLPGGIALTWPATRFRVSLFQLEDSDLAEQLRASHSVGHSRNPALKSRIPSESDVAVSVSPLTDCHPRVEACVSGFINFLGLRCFGRTNQKIDRT